MGKIKFRFQDLEIWRLNLVDGLMLERILVQLDMLCRKTTNFQKALQGKSAKCKVRRAKAGK